MRLRDNFSRFPRAFWFLWAGQLANRLGYFVELLFSSALERRTAVSTT